MGRGIAGRVRPGGVSSRRLRSGRGRRERLLRAAIEGSWERAVATGKLVAGRGREARRRCSAFPNACEDAAGADAGHRGRSGAARAQAPGLRRRSTASVPDAAMSGFQHVGALDHRDRERNAAPRNASWACTSSIPWPSMPLVEIVSGAADVSGRPLDRAEAFAEVARQAGHPRRRRAGVRDVAAGRRARPGGHADGRGGGRDRRRHRPGDGARVRAPDGAAQDERSRRTRRAARDRARRSRPGSTRVRFGPPRSCGASSPRAASGRSRARASTAGRATRPSRGRQPEGPEAAAAPRS